jgi:hypothetical protein
MEPWNIPRFGSLMLHIPTDIQEFQDFNDPLNDTLIRVAYRHPWLYPQIASTVAAFPLGNQEGYTPLSVDDTC